MSPITAATIQILAMLKLMDDDERDFVFRSLAEKYCLDCGKERDRNFICHCENDE
jgi:hypothetical protein